MSSEANVGIEINPVQPLDTFDQLGVESVTHISQAGFLDGEKVFVKKPVITALDRVFKSNNFVEIPLFEQNDSNLDICTDVFLDYQVQNASPTLDTCIVPAPYHFERIELLISGRTVESWYGDHLWYFLRSASQEQIRSYEEMYGFSHSAVPWEESVQSQRRSMELAIGLVDYETAPGVTSRYIETSPTAAGTVIPGLATTTAAVAGLEVYNVQNAVFGGFIARNSTRQYTLRLPPHALWDGAVNIGHNKEKVSLRIYPRVGTALFSDQCKKTYGAPINATVHANSNLLNMVQLQAGVIGITLKGEAKAALDNRSRMYNVHCKNLSPRFQYFQYVSVPSSSQLVATTLTGLEGRFKNLIFFLQETPTDGGEAVLQIKKVYSATNQVTDILPRSTFRMDQCSLLDSSGQSIWANQLPNSLLKRALQLADYGPRGSVFQSEMEFTEFDFSALQDQGDEKVSRAGGSRVIHNSSRVEFYVPDSAALVAAGVSQLQLIMLGYELDEYVQTPAGTLIKVTSRI